MSHLLNCLAAGWIVCMIGTSCLLAWSKKPDPQETDDDDETDFYHSDVILISRKRKTA